MDLLAGSGSPMPGSGLASGQDSSRAPGARLVLDLALHNTAHRALAYLALEKFHSHKLSGCIIDTLAACCSVPQEHGVWINT